MKTQAIGQLKAKHTAYCTICGCSHKRTLAAPVFSREQESYDKAKAEITKKAEKQYTCRVCQSIVKSLK